MKNKLLLVLLAAALLCIFAISSIRSKKRSPQSFRFVTQIISDIQIIIQNRLQTLSGDVLIHSFQIPVVIDFKLLISLHTV